MKKINILLLEDSKVDADMIRKELEEEGLCFNLTRIETENDFIRHVKNGGYDIILSDYNLPQFDGLSALQITQDLAPSLPFIIVTGSLSEEVAAQCIQRGAWDYVVKERLFRLSSSINKCLALNIAKTSSQQAEETRKK
ncbi:MAG: response regulator, partial [Candidatus Cloacimonetes bacterium]|nr:response regulator [Candidatus Cloacimonadota bacterium]